MHLAESTSPLHDLRVDGRVSPLGRPASAPVFSWAVDASDPVASDPRFRVEVHGHDGEPLWDARTERPWAVYDGAPLSSRARYRWRVSALRNDGAVAASASSGFEIGLESAAQWRASWISAPPHPFARETDDPCPLLRREFDLDAVPGAARLYITALGLYRVWLNGSELTDDALYRPGWTDYRVRVHHQTYDCTSLLTSGRNTLAVMLAKGWYAGRLGLLREPAFYGSRPALLAQVEADGDVLVATSPDWRASTGGVVATDLIRGEVQDLRREPSGWRTSGFDDGGWQECDEVEHAGAVVPQPHETISTHRTHPGRLVRQHGRGPLVFDFGQNLVGWTRVTGPLLPGLELVVRHGEVLTPEELVYRDNLRGAFQEDRYVVGDAEPRTVEPSFGMHGFRYAEVWGLPGTTPYGSFDLRPDCSVEAVSVTGLPRRAGTFRCSEEDLTRLAENIEWTVRDNFLEVATDCPQRDERHGWLGDAGAIGASASYHFDLHAFLVKFTQDAMDAQGPDGEIRNYAPAVPPTDQVPGAPGWSDGYIRLVHLLVERYAGLPTAARLYASMRDFLEHVDRHNPRGIRTAEVGADFGDWLSLPEDPDEETHPGYAWTGAHSTTPRPIVDTAHSYRSFVQAAEIADRLGRTEDATRWRTRAEEIRQAYLTEFVLPDGSIKDGTQTAYAQAIGFGLLVGEAADRAADHLRRRIEQVGHLTTGIHGVQHLLPALADHGHADLALRLLFRREMPGWLHMVGSGATTIWEKWDGIRPDGSMSTAEMNSFNHCALGSVGRFLFERVAGLDTTHTTWTGEVRVRALYPGQLDWAEADHDAAGGRVVSRWERRGTEIVHQVSVPGALRARFEAPDVRDVRVDDAVRSGPFVLGPGSHTVVLSAGPASGGTA